MKKHADALSFQSGICMESGAHMTVQSVLLPNPVCDVGELYVRTRGSVRLHENRADIGAGAVLRTDTYMNLFDAGAWLRYTGIRRWTLTLCAAGKGNIRLICRKEQGEYVVAQMQLDEAAPRTLELSFEHVEPEGMYYFETEAAPQDSDNPGEERDGTEPGIRLWDACYAVGEEICPQDIRLALGICTYRRRESLYRNLRELRTSRFFAKTDAWYGKLRIYVVDNASELPEPEEEFIRVYHNPNTGGSGGFTRGIREIRREETTYHFTNVIFMDDDVEVLAESFYRLYALLSLAKEDYRKETVAGRMFRTDKRGVQYTAAEIWNGGSIRHIGWNLDMTAGESLMQMNDNRGAQYGGWWFACFPMDFVRENTPLPFFLHCDDVEYGLRHGGTPVILNGIQVWHETFEYRQNPVILYYDTRNSLIVNAIYGWLPGKTELLELWRKKRELYRQMNDLLAERLLLLGILDFLETGEKIAGGLINGETAGQKKHRKIQKLGNKLCQRPAGSIIRQNERVWKRIRRRLDGTWNKIHKGVYGK